MKQSTENLPALGSRAARPQAKGCRQPQEPEEARGDGFSPAAPGGRPALLTPGFRAGGPDLGSSLQNQRE